MATSYKEVQEDDFSKFGGERSSFLLIEAKLLEIGGMGPAGVKYKKEVLKAAGWKYGELVTYLSRASAATEVFNKIRAAMEKTTDSKGLLELLKN